MNQVVLVHPIVFQGKNLGTIYIRSDLQRFYTRVWQYLKILALVLLASMLAALAVSKLFGRAVARPLMNLAELARIVSRDKNYAVRAPETDTGGEIELLITAFNKMLQEIQLRDRELRVARTGLEKRVEERTRQLVATNRELEAFSYSVSHDLRNPLEAINGFSYLLRKGYGDKLDAEGKEYLQEISAATMRMAELIDDLLSFSQASTAEMSRENVDLSALVTNISAELRRRDPVRSVDFVIAKNVTAEGDSRLLRIVLDNLLSNAWKYTSGREKARVEFGRMQENGATIYYVSDNGVGFNPQSKDRLFKPFQRLHSKAEFPGTGVGLATVRRIINRHGGQIWAEATLEKGATFYFMLDSEIPVLKRA
jgi:light-regulated signal transduction histidine kinase (bacteriophytochrome)